MMKVGYNPHPHYVEDALKDAKVTLCNEELWGKFHKHTTEMIVTKNGRRMFPLLGIQITDLDPNADYYVYIEFAPSSNCRFKYSSKSGWVPAGSGEAQHTQRLYEHSDSPSSGERWMSQMISFGRVKLTNTAVAPPGHMILSSMHKYQPQIIITQTRLRNFPWAPRKTFCFPENQFIAVTAYQNEEITKLKIDNNPFAKGFRENGQAKSKRKREAQEKREQQEDECIKVDFDSSDDTSSSSPSLPPLTPPPVVHSMVEERLAQPVVSNSYRYCYPTYNSYLQYQYLSSVFNVPQYGLSPEFYLPYCRDGYNPYNTPTLKSPNLVNPHKDEKPKKLTDFSIAAIMSNF